MYVDTNETIDTSQLSKTFKSNYHNIKTSERIVRKIGGKVSTQIETDMLIFVPETVLYQMLDDERVTYNGLRLWDVSRNRLMVMRKMGLL